MTDVFSPNGGVFLRKLAAWMATEGHDLDTAVAARLPHVTTLSAEMHNFLSPRTCDCLGSGRDAFW